MWLLLYIAATLLAAAVGGVDAQCDCSNTPGSSCVTIGNSYTPYTYSCALAFNSTTPTPWIRMLLNGRLTTDPTYASTTYKNDVPRMDIRGSGAPFFVYSNSQLAGFGDTMNDVMEYRQLVVGGAVGTVSALWVRGSSYHALTDSYNHGLLVYNRVNPRVDPYSMSFWFLIESTSYPTSQDKILVDDVRTTVRADGTCTLTGGGGIFTTILNGGFIYWLAITSGTATPNACVLIREFSLSTGIETSRSPIYECRPATEDPNRVGMTQSANNNIHIADTVTTRFDVTIWDVNIWDVALTQQQMASIYDFTPIPTTLAPTTTVAPTTTPAPTTTTLAPTTIAATTTTVAPTTVSATTTNVTPTTEAATTTATTTTTTPVPTTTVATTTTLAPTTVTLTTTITPTTTIVPTTTTLAPTTVSASTTVAPTTTTARIITINLPSGAYGLGGAAFGVNPLTVNIGDTVVWTNNDITAHTVTSTDASGTNRELSSGTIAVGTSYSHTFLRVGDFTYACLIHSTMNGEVEVIDPTATQAPTTTPAPTTVILSPFETDGNFVGWNQFPPLTANSVCNYHGLPGNRGFCVCNIGYTGIHCEKLVASSFTVANVSKTRCNEDSYGTCRAQGIACEVGIDDPSFLSAGNPCCPSCLPKQQLLPIKDTLKCLATQCGDGVACVDVQCPNITATLEQDRQECSNVTCGGSNACNPSFRQCVPLGQLKLILPAILQVNDSTGAIAFVTEALNRYCTNPINNATCGYYSSVFRNINGTWNSNSSTLTLSYQDITVSTSGVLITMHGQSFARRRLLQVTPTSNSTSTTTIITTAVTSNSTNGNTTVVVVPPPTVAPTTTIAPTTTASPPTTTVIPTTTVAPTTTAAPSLCAGTPCGPFGTCVSTDGSCICDAVHAGAVCSSSITKLHLRIPFTQINQTYLDQLPIDWATVFHTDAARFTLQSIAINAADGMTIATYIIAAEAAQITPDEIKLQTSIYCVQNDTNNPLSQYNTTKQISYVVGYGSDIPAGSSVATVQFWVYIIAGVGGAIVLLVIYLACRKTTPRGDAYMHMA